MANGNPNIVPQRVRTQSSKGHKQKSPARNAGFFIWRRAKLALLSRQIKSPGERSEPGLFLLVSPLVGRIGSLKVIQHKAYCKYSKSSKPLERPAFCFKTISSFYELPELEDHPHKKGLSTGRFH